MMSSTPPNPSPNYKPSIYQNRHQIWPQNTYYDFEHPQQPIIFPEAEQEEQVEVLQEEEEEEEEEGEKKEHMFEKPLTPSDVGKLNRLVIPKQHAEKYFPLSGTESAEKGFLLSFEDELGQSWRFRYSYWTSSQSYVLTKGWSRFVKEKQLDAGDVVTFERLRFHADKFFIRCRRRSLPAHVSHVPQPVTDASAVWAHAFYHAHQSQFPSYLPPPSHRPHHQPCCLDDVAEPVGGGGGGAAPSSITKPGNSKRLRLFGVNLDCQMDESGPQGPECSGLSGQGPAQLVFSQAHGPTHYNHM